MRYACYPCGAVVSDEEHTKVQALFDAIDLLDLHWEFGDGLDGRTSLLSNRLGLYHCVGRPENFDSTSSVVVCQGCLDDALKATKMLEMLDYPNTPQILVDHRVKLTGVERRCEQCGKTVRVVKPPPPFRICSECFTKNQAEEATPDYSAECWPPELLHPDTL